MHTIFINDQTSHALEKILNFANKATLMKLQMLYFCRYCIKLRDVIDKTCRNVLNILEFISGINIAIIFNKKFRERGNFPHISRYFPQLNFSVQPASIDTSSSFPAPSCSASQRHFRDITPCDVIPFALWCYLLRPHPPLPLPEKSSPLPSNITLLATSFPSSSPVTSSPSPSSLWHPAHPLSELLN